MRHLLRLILSACLALPASLQAAYVYSDLYVFGDSLSDTRARVTNGRLWVEYLAPRLGLDYDQATNFARSGSDSSDILGQVSAYAAGTRADPQGLYVVWGGAVDLFENPLFPGPAIERATRNLARAVGTLRGVGAEHILVPNLPDLGLTQAARSLSLEDLARDASQDFNRALDREVAPYDPLEFDVFALITQVAAHPGDYGLSHVRTSCLDDGAGPACEGYLFYDEIHPTTQAHRILGDALFTAVVPLPPGLVLLPGGLLLLGGFAMRARRPARRRLPPPAGRDPPPATGPARTTATALEKPAAAAYA